MQDGGAGLRRQNTLFFAGKRKLCQIFTGIFGKSVYASIASHKSVDSIKLAT